MSVDPTTGRLRLGLGLKLNYGIGALVTGIGGGGALPLLALYGNQVLGLPADLVGLTIMLSVIVDAVLDPLIGRWSDGTRSRWGRRHPFMYASAIPTAAAFYALWHPPAGLPLMTLFGYMLAMQLAVRICISLFDLPNASLAPELAPNYDDRTGLISWRFFFGAFGGGLMTMLLYGVFLRKDASHPLGILNRDGYAQFATLTAIVMFVVILVSSLATHSTIPHLAQAPIRRLTLAQTLRELRATFSNKPFMTLVLSGLISGISGGVGGTLGTYFYLYYWGLTPQMVGWLTPIALVAIVIAVILAPILARRFDKKPTMLALFVASAASGVIPIALRLIGLMPPNGSPALLAILLADGLFSGLLGVTGLVIIASMMSDVVEDVAVTTGVRSEGLLFSASGLLPKVTTAIGAGLAGLMLTAVHFPAHAQPGTVDPAVLRHLAYLWLPIGVVFQAGSIAVLFFYRLDRSAHARNLELLDAAAIMSEEHTAPPVTPIGAPPTTHLA